MRRHQIRGHQVVAAGGDHCLGNEAQKVRRSVQVLVASLLLGDGRRTDERLHAEDEARQRHRDDHAVCDQILPGNAVAEHRQEGQVLRELDVPDVHSTERRDQHHDRHQQHCLRDAEHLASSQQNVALVLHQNTSTAADVFPIMRPAADKQLMMIKVRLTASHP